MSMLFGFRSRWFSVACLSLGLISCGHRASYDGASDLEADYSSAGVAQELFAANIHEVSVFVGGYSRALHTLSNHDAGVFPSNNAAFIIFEMPTRRAEQVRGGLQWDVLRGVAEVFSVSAVSDFKSKGTRSNRRLLIAPDLAVAARGGTNVYSTSVYAIYREGESMVPYDQVISHDPVGTIVDLIRIGEIRALNVNLDFTTETKDLARVTELLVRLNALSPNGIASGALPKVTVHVVAGPDNSLTNKFLAAHENLKAIFPAATFRIVMADEEGNAKMSAETKKPVVVDVDSPEGQKYVSGLVEREMYQNVRAIQNPGPNSLAAINRDLAGDHLRMSQAGSASYQERKIRVKFDRSKSPGNVTLASAAVIHVDGNTRSLPLRHEAGVTTVEAPYANADFTLDLAFKLSDGSTESLKLKGETLAAGVVGVGVVTSASKSLVQFVEAMERASAVADMRIALDGLDPNRPVSRVLAAHDIDAIYKETSAIQSINKDTALQSRLASAKWNLDTAAKALESARPRISEIGKEHQLREGVWKQRIFERFAKPRL